VIALITKIEGIIIHSTDYGDTSKIIQILNQEGQIGVMCKGAKSLKSTLRASTLKYTYGFFYIYKKDDKLSTLKEVDVINPFLNIHNDIILISYMTYLCDLVKQVYKESNNPQVFNLLISILKKMEEGLNPQILTNILEIKLLPSLGVGIELDACIKCGATTNIITINGDAGGYICKKCHRGEQLVSLKTIKMLRLYYYVDIDSIKELNIKEDTIQEINLFLNRYYDRYTGLYLKSKTFLEELTNKKD